MNYRNINQASECEGISNNQYCNRCGRSVRFGSGWFVNRVPDFNDPQTRIANGWRYFEGDYVCAECDGDMSSDSVIIAPQNGS